MNRFALVTTLVLGLSYGASMAADGPTAPYNEAVKIVNGKRVVEVVPFPPHMKFAVNGFKKPSEIAREVPVDSVETAEGLMDCYGTSWYHPKACSPSTFGSEKRHRQWTVKRNGKWMVCVSQAKPTECIPLAPDGQLRALPAVRE